MRFEFDPAKSEANKRKHGIDFIEAQGIWNDPDRLERPARSTTEARVQVIGGIRQEGFPQRLGIKRQLWSAFVTYRHDDQTIRIISVRSCRPNEAQLYL